MAALQIIFGEIPDWANAGVAASGDGDGSGGYGSGPGYGDDPGSGYGCYGYGSGPGYGDGYGDGYGGFGDGSGSGYGYGYGDGSGGFGDGSGSGPGYGDGDGSGGFGDGSGDGSYWLSVYRVAVAAWPVAQRKRLGELEITASAIAFWRSDRRGLPANGGQDNGQGPAIAGTIHESSGPLILCKAGTLHATLNPSRWKGDRLWVVALFGEVKRDGDKLGALRREIIGEIRDFA